jgi:hypothetical protein
MGDKKLRGSVLNGYLKFIKKKWGNQAYLLCVENIGIGQDGFVEGDWYKYEYSEKLLIWLAKEKGKDQLEALGRFTIQNMGLLSYIVRFMDVKSIIKKSPKTYKDAFNFGRIEVYKLEDKKAVYRTHDVSQNEYSCIAWGGVCYGFLDATRTKGTVEKTKCIFKGDDYCEYVMEWD